MEPIRVLEKKEGGSKQHAAVAHTGYKRVCRLCTGFAVSFLPSPSIVLLSLCYLPPFSFVNCSPAPQALLGIGYF